MESSRFVNVHLERLQDLVLDSPEITDFLDDLAALSVGLVAESVDAAGSVEVACGVTLIRRRTPVTVASSGPEAVRLDEMQYSHQQGPCLEAARTGKTVHVQDVWTDTRWPAYFAEVREYGYPSILGFPLPLGDAGRAALNVYAKPAGAFEPELVLTLEDYARHSAKALRVSLRVAASATRAAHLTAAMESRTAIDMAVGIIIGQNKCTQEEAVGILRRASSNRNMKLREVAEEIIWSYSGGPVRTHFE